MRRFVPVSMLSVVLLGLIGCTAPAPAANAPLQPSTSPALTQPTPPAVVPSATSLLPTPQAAPSATRLPPTRPPAAPPPTSLPPTTMATSVAQGGWSQIDAANSGPPARYDHSAVVDPVRQQLVIFGGRDTETFGDTWIFDRATRMWRAVDSAGPAPRFGHGAVYDAVQRRMLIVMGQGADFFNDVWAFDLDQETWTELKANDGSAAARWVNLTPTSGSKPLKRCLHALIYEAAADRMILFGGCSSGFGPCPQGDLWAFDLKTTTWTELTPRGAAPTARSNASLVYEAATRSLFLFGGKTESGASAETWSYDLDGNEWMQLERADGPSARSSQATSYDTQTGRALIFGGLTADGSSADLWEWTG